MVIDLYNLFRSRELLYMLTWREVRVKYKQSVMGFLWAVLMPALVVSAGILVKYVLSIYAAKPFTFEDVGAMSVKALPWSFFVSSIRFSTNSLVANTNLVTKIAFPKEVFPIASVLSQLVDFVVASTALSIFLLAGGVSFTVHALIVPFLVAALIVLAAGAGMLLSASSLFFRDVKYVVEVVLTFGIFVTPVFYEASLFGPNAKFILLNPVAPILEAFADCLIYHRLPESLWLVYSAGFAIALCISSYALFKKLEPSFAESI